MSGIELTREQFIKIINENGRYDCNYDPFLDQKMNALGIYYVHNVIRNKTSALTKKEDYLQEIINLKNDELEKKDNYCKLLSNCYLNLLKTYRQES